MLCGNRSINQMYSTTKYFDAVGPVKESKSQHLFKDLIQCMYFSDDWDDEAEDRWDEYHTKDKEGLKARTAQHRK